MFVRATLIAFALLATPASAQITLPPIPTIIPTSPIGPAPQPYQANDATGFHSILPSGTRGRYSLLELAAHLTTGAKVPHCCDQLPMYDGLVQATPGLKQQDIPKYFKDGSFGVKADDVERTYHPRPDVTVVRDRGFGVPHVYGTTRSAAMFGLGYVGAEDRLFFMDVLRHAGRGELSSFAGGANQGQDAEQWAVAPYTEADLERQVADLPKYLGAQGARIVTDAENYLAGVNQYILEAKLDPTKMPGEYVAIGRPLGPELFKPADIIATAAMVGGIFGKGGGKELQFSLLADALEDRFGRRGGARAFKDFRAAEDPEAPVTVFEQRFPYQVPPKRPTGVARPDKGTLKLNPTGTSGAFFPGTPVRASNALLVSGAESESGHPLMVAGPQVGYFNPQILMEQGVHAPATADGPGIDAQGASFVGINLYVQLGRGRDYAWSATSAGQDIIDTFALELCDATHYRFRGRCEPIEVLEKTNRWLPTPADQTKPGSQKLRAERTKLGLVAGRGKVRGKPVIFTKLRSTYFHEIDSAAGFMDFNTPEVVKDTASFQRAAAKVGYTFNWFYADAEHTAYFNSGLNPVRAADVSHDFPVAAEHEWQGWNPDTWQATVTPERAAPAGHRPGLFRQLEQQAGQGLSLLRRQRVLLHVSLRAARGPCQGADRGTEEDDAAATDRHDGAGRDDRPARPRRPPARAEGDRAPAQRRAAQCRRQAARLARRRRPPARPQPRRRLRARGRDPDHGRLVAALGRGAVQAHARRRRVQGPDRDGQDRQPAQQRGRASRLGLSGLVVRLRLQGPAHHAGREGAWEVLARVLRQARGVPREAATVAARGGEGARERALRRRRGLQEGDQARPAVVL